MRHLCYPPSKGGIKNKKKYHPFIPKGEERILRHIVPPKAIMLPIYGKYPRERNGILNNTEALFLQTTWKKKVIVKWFWIAQGHPQWWEAIPESNVRHTCTNTQHFLSLILKANKKSRIILLLLCSQAKYLWKLLFNMVRMSVGLVLLYRLSSLNADNCSITLLSVC